jgi:hypothetical protein
VTSPEHSKWRVGTHYNIHVYAMQPGEDRNDDVPVGTFLTPELAAEAVFAHNRLLRTFPSDEALDEKYTALEVDTPEVVEETTPQWEHLPECIDDDCQGCAPKLG